MVGYMIINNYHQIPILVTQPRLGDIVKRAKVTYLFLALSDGIQF